MQLQPLKFRDTPFVRSTAAKVTLASEDRSSLAEPTESFEASSTPAPAEKGLISRFLGVGQSLAMACLNGVAGLGLFLIGPRLTEKKEADYREGEKTLAADPEFRQRVATSAFDGLLELLQRPDLPGDSAKERLDFVMWYTDSNRDTKLGSWDKLKQIFTHFQSDNPFLNQANDRGFATDVADSSKWYDPQATGFVMAEYTNRIEQASPQVGHFLTAVDIGRQHPILNSLLRPAAVGHELIGDDQGPLNQIVVGLTHGTQRALFGQAIEAATQGNRVQAHSAVKQALPELSAHGQEPGRVGNSKQDLLNTSYGMAFGQMMRRGAFKTRQEAADWLYNNVGMGAVSLPWS